MLTNYDTQIVESAQFAEDPDPAGDRNEALHHTPPIETERQLPPRTKLLIVVGLALVAWAIPISAAVFL
jgi:hypothetical protein